MFKLRRIELLTSPRCHKWIRRRVSGKGDGLKTRQDFTNVTLCLSCDSCCESAARRLINFEKGH